MTALRAALFALLLTGCPPPADAPEQPAAPPQVALYGVKVRSFDGSTLKAQGRAAKLSFHRSSSEFVATEARLRLIGPNALELTAPTVSGTLQQQQVQATGGVVVRTGTGLTATTARARYDGITGRATGDAKIRVDGPGQSLDADGFEADLPAERFVFTGDVRSRFEGTP